MNRIFVVVLFLLSGVIFPTAVGGADQVAARGEAWQKNLDESKFEFNEAQASFLYSLSQFGGKCQIEMIYDPARSSNLTFKFVRDGKELFTIEGHKSSVFLAYHDVLYFAEFAPWDSGCVVTAHNLDTGEKLWETRLKAVGTPEHSAYVNEVTMALSALPHEEKPDVVFITGREGYGDYREVLDIKTGEILAHKIYRQGFGK
jgi:hypothetical protein